MHFEHQLMQHKFKFNITIFVLHMFTHFPEIDTDPMDWRVIYLHHTKNITANNIVN